MAGLGYRYLGRDRRSRADRKERLNRLVFDYGGTRVRAQYGVLGRYHPDRGFLLLQLRDDGSLYPTPVHIVVHRTEEELKSMSGGEGMVVGRLNVYLNIRGWLV
jgi:hypothetical protein